MRTRPPHASRRRHRTRTPLRLRLRSPVLYWCAVGVLAAATILSIERSQRDLDRQAAALGPTDRVAVVSDDHAAGDRLDEADVELREIPRSITPTDALTTAPGGRRLRTDVTAGEVLTAGRFAPGRPSAIVARIPNGARAIAVPQPIGALDLHPGDVVDLLAVGPDGTSRPVAADGIVVASTEEAATVAVPADEVGQVADAVLAGTLTVVLTASA